VVGPCENGKEHSVSVKSGKYLDLLSEYKLLKKDSVIQNNLLYEGVSKISRTRHLERELQMVQLPATRYSCIAIL
jgi:hypothetical protein